MPSASDILQTKGSQIHCTDPSATVFQATQKMNQHKLGALVVMKNGRIAGMFTERDVLRRVVGEMRNPTEVTVGEVMTTDVICCRPETDIDEVGQLMRQRRIRHVPVCDTGGTPLGLISIGDLNAFYQSQQESTILMLNDYIYGRA